MDRLRTASGRTFRHSALVATAQPFAADAAAMPGAVVLGADGSAYQSLQIYGSGAFAWCRLVAEDPSGYTELANLTVTSRAEVLGSATVAQTMAAGIVMAGQAAQSADTAKLLVRVSDDLLFDADLYEIGTPGRIGFGVAMVPPSDLPLDHAGLSGSTFYLSGDDYGNYLHWPSAGFPKGRGGFGGSIAIANLPLGQPTNYLPGSIVMSPQQGGAFVDSTGRLQPMGVVPVDAPITLDAATVPGAQVLTPDGQVWQSQRWGGVGVYRWRVAQRALLPPIPTASTTIGTPGQQGFGIGCAALAAQPNSIYPAGPTWFIRSRPDFGNYVMPKVDGDVGLLDLEVAIISEPVTGGAAARYRVGSTSIHPETGVFWTVATDGTWTKQSTL